MDAESAVPVVWSEATLAHRPDREVWIGMPMDGTELPERVRVIERRCGAPDTPSGRPPNTRTTP